jgi:AcrR family transcriptional regulator
VTGKPRQSRDVTANRAQIVAAAAAVFEQQGLSADMRAVARAAGFGIGTLYRHFPTREELLRAVTDTDLRELAALGLPPDAVAVEAVRAFYTAGLTRLARNRALLELLADIRPTAAEFDACLRHLTAIGRAAIERSAHDGTLAADLTAADIAYQFLALARIVPLLPDPAAVEHQIVLVTRGFGAPVTPASDR